MHETIAYNGLTLHKWTLGSSTFLACPEQGARLMNWHLRLADTSVRDVIHWPEDADLTDIAKIRGGNPILFPFCARTYHEGTIGQWKAPDGQVRPMPNHGFARQGTFLIKETRPDGFTAVLQPDADALAAYPFQYRFAVSYHFSELDFRVDLTLRNLDEHRIPWSAGHHFYFTLPWHENGQRQDYRLEIPAKKAFRVTPTGALEEDKEWTKALTFDAPGMSDRIHCKLKKNEASFGPLNGEEDVRVIFGNGDTTGPSAWTALTTWTENDESPFYCVEPWMGPPNAPEHGHGLHYVEPAEEETFSVTISLV